MLENEFEKRVQQRMDEFQLRPSDAVWQNVELGLRKKKRRRVIVFAFLLAGLGLLGYSGLYIFNHSNKILVDQKSTPSTPSQHQTPAPNNNAATLRAGENNTSAKGTRPGTSNVPGASRPGQAARPKNRQALRTEKTGAPRITGSNKNANAPRIAKKEPSNNQINEPKKPSARQTPETVKVMPETRATKIAQPDQAIVTKEENTLIDPVNDKPGIISENKSDLPTLKDELAAADSSKLQQPVIAEAAMVAKSSKNKKPAISWGMDLSAGFAEHSKNAFPFSDGQKSLDAANAPLPGTGAMPTLGPSTVDPGFGFTVGPVVEWQASRKSRFSAGLQYAYRSTKMRVGTYTYSTVVVYNSFAQYLRLNAFYQGIHQQDYTNRYHFIQLPVKYHLQLNKGHKLPIQWDIGLTPGYLVSSNALSYDTVAGGIYYRDKEMFNKFQLNVTTGLSFRFGTKGRLQWSLGPEVALGMNKLINGAPDRKQYLFYGGLGGRLIFNKKK